MEILRSALLCLCVYVIRAQNCPPREDTYPCLCLEKQNEVHIHCSGLTSLEQLKRPFKGLHGTKILTFTISGSSIDHLPGDIFQNVSIRNLIISKSSLERIGNLGEPQFQGLETSLESLKIEETFTEKHPFAYVSIDHLKKLKTLELRKNQVEVLHNEWFKNGPANMEVLRFVEGKIRRVGYKALQNLSKLRIVDLSDNELDYIPNTVFPEPADFLEEINLERNKLSSFDEGFFSKMPSLKIVNLELNEFSTIDETTWGTVWSHIHTFTIDYNPIICDSKIKWIYEEGTSLENKVIATCFKPFTLMDRELHTLEINELK
ncbi:hypothetical protein JTE90_000587 [Oedothorax gibbosus]|uniref:Uncharacterized protein n=1 Tax=Oedothorax gibbosus TaxID=931172 RepID=A0AAV6VWQ7_9ARAC|nr:hypothetical protein JTE90_000587 [Oedothorax gibbosus]